MVRPDADTFLKLEPKTHAFPQARTLGDQLRAASYATHFVGKWNAGVATHALTPSARGFDSALGMYTHGADHFTARSPVQEADVSVLSLSPFPSPGLSVALPPLAYPNLLSRTLAHSLARFLALTRSRSPS
eukprot:6213484-Pleurochrysis_carterae.AAC.1